MQLDYIHHKWENDDEYREKQKQKYKDSQFDECPICGGKKLKKSEMCLKCYRKHNAYVKKKSKDVIKSLESININDSESLFYNKDLSEVLNEFGI